MMDRHCLIGDFGCFIAKMMERNEIWGARDRWKSGCMFITLAADQQSCRRVKGRETKFLKNKMRQHAHLH